MRRIIWSPKALHDYTSIIDYLLSIWTVNEVQHFIDKVMSALTILEKGNFDFRKVGSKDYRMIVIQKQVSIIYRCVTLEEIQIIRIWDNRQNPAELK